MKNILILAAFMFALSSCGQKTEDAKDLKKETIQLNLTIGETYTTTIEAEMSSAQQNSGSQNQLSSSIFGTIAFKVLSENDGVYDMEVSYTRLGMSMISGSINFSGDSDNPDPDNIFSTILHNMMNKAFRVKMKKDGSIAEITKIDTLFSSLFVGLPDLDEDMQLMLTEQMKNSFGINGLKANLEQMTAIYPSKPVARGEKWSKTIQLESTMKATQEVTYSYKSSDEKEFVISGIGTITTNKNEIVESSGYKYQYDLLGDVDAEIYIDRKTGWVKHGKVKQEFSGDMYILENELIEEKMTVPVEIITITDYSTK
jgi:hypothetical protein